MNILISCEMSGVVREAFRRKGHNAYSCDLLRSLDNSPYHYVGDVTEHLNDDLWDMIIAFPPCTYLTVAGYHWCYHLPAKPKKGVLYGPARLAASIEAEAFFMKHVNAKAKKIVIENPTGVMNTRYKKPDQTLQPWQFGHTESKGICLWLKGVQPLKPTKNVYDEMMKLPLKQRTRVHYMSANGENGLSRSEARSLTLQGVADAFAEQWG